MAVATENYADFDIVEIARRCGITILKPATNGQWLARCPFCGDSSNEKHGHLYLRPDTGEYRCQKCGDGGFTIGFYAKLRKISNKDAYRELLRVTDKVPEIHQRAKPVQVENPVASLDRRHHVYTALLAMLSLLPMHKADLLKRGLAHEAIVRNGYKSYPLDKKKRLDICRSLSQKFDLTHIPGFYTDDAGAWNIVNLPNGYFLPARNLRGEIQGLQIRVFPFNKEFHRNKFFWLSSPDKPNGAGASNWLHTSIPPGKRVNGRVWLTEGSLKADVASFFTGAPFFAIPGTSAPKDILSVLQKLGVEQVVMAFDADQLTIKPVWESVNKLDSEIKAAKITTMQATWPIDIKDGEVSPKGIDDACLERANKSLEVNEESFTVLTKTVTKKVTWDIRGETPIVTFEETVSHKYEVKGVPSLLGKIGGFFKK